MKGAVVILAVAVGLVVLVRLARLLWCYVKRDMRRDLEDGDGD